METQPVFQRQLKLFEWLYFRRPGFSCFCREGAVTEGWVHGAANGGGRLCTCLVCGEPKGASLTLRKQVCTGQKGLWVWGSCRGYGVILEDRDKYRTPGSSSRAMPSVWFMPLLDIHLLADKTRGKSAAAPSLGRVCGKKNYTQDRKVGLKDPLLWRKLKKWRNLTE